ncbi:Major facilitator transporter-like protein [Mycena venus]|uniref:Major facilitator transporter-like protein n=1 Tax=Mycena venus TaxID=2733690 RepID=A0A8H6X7S9_9AGAR|nr:Major facilitator transporter-like protein [Mycena venus]
MAYKNAFHPPLRVEPNHFMSQRPFHVLHPQLSPSQDFNSFSLQGWISDSYILAETIFILIHGKFLRIFAAKWVLVSGIALFEIGSLLCGVAQGVGQIIAGRTVSGMGTAAICDIVGHTPRGSAAPVRETTDPLPTYKVIGKANENGTQRDSVE